jgi:DtxR family Mn-dependent transcriptional regulator
MSTTAEQDYLKAIFHLTRRKDRAGTGDLASHLGVTPASVTGMLRRLCGRLPAPVHYEKHGGVALTPEGRRHALDTLRKHRLLELFLVRELGFGWDEVHEEAERLEHAVSDLLIERMAHKLGDPEVDPHGDPIPRPDGTLPEHPAQRLLDLPVGARARIIRIEDQQPELLRYLGSLGLVPGTRFLMLGQEPFEGPVGLQVERATLRLGQKAASAVYVQGED